jgi:antirestriction protein
MIYKTVTSNSEFYHWLKQSDNYSNNFSYDGANALQEYLEQLSEDIGEDIEFDPIAWCCEFSEYDSLDDFNRSYWGEGKTEDAFTLEELQDETTVIELDNGHIIVGEF